jgi:DNA modification methylase
MEPGNNLSIRYVPTDSLKAAEYNPRTWDKEAERNLQESIKRYGVVDPLIANNAPGREGVVIGGHFRLAMLKELGIETVPVVYLTIPDIEKERELNLRLNRNTGAWDWNLLSKFNEELLSGVGFTSEELDDIFRIEETPEQFDLEKELAKLKIETIAVQKGDVYALGDSRLMCGDSTVGKDMRKLMGDERADFCFTDPPYILDYLKGKKKSGKAITGFGNKRDRRYLETDVLPPDFTERWMVNVKKAAKDDFHIIVFENWKNIPTIWHEMERYWKVRNMIVWHVPNRVQGFAAKYRFFNKHDIAIVGQSGEPAIHGESEGELLDNEYETALYATAGKPHWEPYEKGKKYCPTDFIEHAAADEKSSGQGIIFGTKPLPLLIPYIKVLTKRGDLVLEPFGGSGSTLIAATKMQRRCYLMEKSPVYAEVIKRRWEKLTGLKAKKL